MNKRGLGKGLGALFSETPVSANSDDLLEGLSREVEKIDIEKIMPNKFQPRRVFDEKALGELAESIKEHGVIQPIIVRKVETGYELVAGERRLRAAKIALLPAIPAITREYTDAQMLQIALIENIQREDLNPIEEAQAYRQLIEEFDLTQEEVAQKVGRSRSVIANSIRLLNLHPEIQNFILQGMLTMGQAKPLLAIDDDALQLDAAIKAIAGKYSSRDVEELVKNIINAPDDYRRMFVEEKTAAKNETPSKVFDDKAYVDEYEDRLKLLLGAKVKIKSGKLKSKIEIEFYSNEDLERIIELLSIRIDRTEGYIPKYKGNLVV